MKTMARTTLPVTVTTVEALAALHSELRQWIAARIALAASGGVTP